MTERPGAARELVVGVTTLYDDQPMLVKDVRPPWVLLVDRAGAEYPVQMTGPDQVVVIVEADEAEALQALAGTVMAEVIRDWIRVPPCGHDLSTIHTHMLMLHGVHTTAGKGSKSPSYLLEEHKADHLAELHISHAYVNHQHHA